MDAKMRKKRIEILLAINSISAKCNCISAKESTDCDNCKELRKLGDKLMKLLNKNREGGSHKDKQYTFPAERPNKIFTDEMLSFLKENAHLYTYKEMGEKLGLTDKQVQTKCSAMNIKCKVDRDIYNLYENDILIATGYIAQIARETGIAASNLSKYVCGKRKKTRRRLVKVDESK
ncbi:hypothetical protein ACIQZG_08505 [Lysinibacillus sp. NPDC096418]|uniref:hypothetical protein n=1 Tax=Lysinibacillus sp. NPDC096418 TaxID=3364138 RepID=UPI0038235E2E